MQTTSARRFAPRTHDEILEAVMTNDGPMKQGRCKFCGSTSVEWLTYDKQDESGHVEKAWVLVEAGPDGRLQKHQCQQSKDYYTALHGKKPAPIISPKPKATWKMYKKFVPDQGENGDESL